jgi:hypothetical protein
MEDMLGIPLLIQRLVQHCLPLTLCEYPPTFFFWCSSPPFLHCVGVRVVRRRSPPVVSVVSRILSTLHPNSFLCVAEECDTLIDPFAVRLSVGSYVGYFCGDIQVHSAAYSGVFILQGPGGILYQSDQIDRSIYRYPNFENIESGTICLAGIFLKCSVDGKGFPRRTVEAGLCTFSRHTDQRQRELRF